jgi:anti-sigma factor RsiW
MTGYTKIDGEGLAALEQALERYGSDRTRWPAPVRRDLAALLAGNAEAHRRLAEAEALDRLLDLMPEAEIDTHALAARILAAAKARAPADAPAPTPARRTTHAADTPWGAAALLAASLVIGAFVGVSGTFNSAFETAVIADASDEASTDPGRIAFDDSGALGLFEEDLL